MKAIVLIATSLFALSANAALDLNLSCKTGDVADPSEVVISNSDPSLFNFNPIGIDNEISVRVKKGLQVTEDDYLEVRTIQNNASNVEISGSTYTADGMNDMSLKLNLLVGCGFAQLGSTGLVTLKNDKSERKIELRQCSRIPSTATN